MNRKKKSVQSINLYKSLSEWLCLAGMIQKTYDILKAQPGNLKVETKNSTVSFFIKQLPVN
jgi:hypothetical protein